MTNNEAVEWLKKIKESIHGGDDAMDEWRREALDLAIVALPAHGLDVKQIVDLQKKNDELIEVIDVNGHEINTLRQCLDDAVRLKCRSEDMNRVYERLISIRTEYDDAIKDFITSRNAYDRFLKDKGDGMLVKMHEEYKRGDVSVNPNLY